MFKLIISSLVLHFITISTVSADVYNCNGEHQIGPPKNYNESFYFPTGWNDSMNYVPSFAAGQNCTWKITVPAGSYAYFGASFSPSDSTTILKLTDSLGRVTSLNNSAMDSPYFLVNPGFNIELKTTDTGHFGMRIAWFTIPTNVNPTLYPISSNESPLVLSGDDFNTGAVIQTNSRVSLLSIKPQQATDNNVPTMRLTFVYDGPSLNSTFLGTLYDVMMSGNQLISTGHYMTLYTVWPGKNLGNVAIFQNYQNIANLTNYSGIFCYLNTECNFQIDASKGPAAAIRYYENPTFLTGVDMGQNSDLSVYSGVVSDGTLVSKIGPIQTINSVPQKVDSFLTTFLLDNGVGNFKIIGRQDLAGWSTIFDGRRLTLTSKNINSNSTDQEFSETFSAKGTFNMTLNILNSGLTDSATLRILVKQDKSTVQDVLYSSTKKPDTNSLIFTGNQLTVEYKTQLTKTLGCHVDVEFFKKNGSSLGIFTTILMVLVMFISK